MHDSDHYADPERFDGFRFAQESNRGQTSTASRFIDTRPDWLIWGYGNTTWWVLGLTSAFQRQAYALYHSPGRFYASAVLRLLLCHIVSNFDISLLNPNAGRTMTWRSAIVPRSSTIIVLRPHAQPDGGAAG